MYFPYKALESTDDVVNAFVSKLTRAELSAALVVQLYIFFICDVMKPQTL